MSEEDVVIESDGFEELGADDAVATSGKLDTLKKELAKVKEERQDYLDGWQRSKADYVNALKRFEQEKAAAIQLGMIMNVRAFLPVIDSLDRAEASGEVPELFKGIAKQLHDAARMLGLVKFGKVGDTFDPMYHEALGQDAAASEEEDNKVTAVLEPGWKSGEGVIRPAKVRVSHFS